MRVLVLGAGLQGAACAFDLLRTPEVEEVRLADLAVDVLPPYLTRAGRGRLVPVRLDARDRHAVLRTLRGCDVALSAVPYYLNASLAAWAVEAGVHFSDLGGNADIVDAERRLDAEARARGVSIVPDCGLAPGLVNIVAELGIRRFDRVESVKLYVGGLPQHPEPPLNYQVVYSLEGVLDYYTTPVLVLENGEVAKKEALTEVEAVDFPEPVGRLEAFLTAGGASRMPYQYRGRIRSMSYKTLRYPGHAYLVKAMRDLGLYDDDPVRVDGWMVSPRDVFIATVGRKLATETGADLVALRVVVEGMKGGERRTITYELLDRYDEALGVTAMMRTTGYSLAAVAILQVQGVVPPGAHTPYESVPVDAYVRALGERGIRIERRES